MPSLKNLTVPFKPTFRNFQPLWIYFVKNRWALVAGVLSLLVVDFLQLMIPLIIKKAINILVVQTSGVGALLVKQGVTIGMIALLIALFRYVWRRLLLGHSRKVEQGLRDRLYGHIQTLSRSFFQNTKTGDLMSRAINDINAVRMACGMGLVALVDGFILGTAAIGFMMSIDWRLTLISLIPAPVVVVVTRMVTQQMSARFERVQKSFSDLTEQARESFSGIRVIKAHQREGWEYGRMKARGEQYVGESMHLARTLALFFPLMTLITNAGLAVVILLGGRYTILGTITPGDFVAFIAYLNLLTWPVMAMGWVVSLIQRGSASMRRINGILEAVPEIQDPGGENGRGPQGKRAEGVSEKAEGSIAFSGLNFRYPGQKEYVLKDVNLKIRAGETIAIVGRVGSGKTTLLQIVPRLLNPPESMVFVDGRDIRNLSLNTLRKKIGFVSQDVFIFSDTVYNNVAFGTDDVTDEEVRQALSVAGIREEMEALDKGLGTLLGERGITLSGGQRQRLTIARAVVGDFPILILDDALSMVDTRTEAGILNRILDLRQDRTNVIVSHRVSTIRRADRIFVFDHGSLKEEGTHESLILLRGIYAALYEEQILSESLENGGVISS
ncbi:MAG: ABC transporter ATP-binding protein [Deltaproteobacteria bacterium]|nr:ABC transporter ATP-binding protein [Deltaproteobacteria bacterium]